MSNLTNASSTLFQDGYKNLVPMSFFQHRLLLANTTRFTRLSNIKTFKTSSHEIGCSRSSSINKQHTLQPCVSLK